MWQKYLRSEGRRRLLYSESLLVVLLLVKITTKLYLVIYDYKSGKGYNYKKTQKT